MKTAPTALQGLFLAVAAQCTDTGRKETCASSSPADLGCKLQCAGHIALNPLQTSLYHYSKQWEDSRVEDVVSRVQAAKHCDLATAIGLNDPSLPCIRSFDIRESLFHTNQPEVMHLDTCWSMRAVPGSSTPRSVELHLLLRRIRY